MGKYDKIRKVAEELSNNGLSTEQALSELIDGEATEAIGPLPDVIIKAFIESVAINGSVPRNYIAQFNIDSEERYDEYDRKLSGQDWTVTFPPSIDPILADIAVKNIKQLLVRNGYNRIRKFYYSTSTNTLTFIV